MLSGISNLLFGGSSSNAAANCDDGSTSTSLDTSPAENEWLLVVNTEKLVPSDTGSSETNRATDAEICEARVNVGTDGQPVHSSSDSESLPASESSTPAKSDVSLMSAGSGGASGSNDEPSDFERFRGPYLSTRDLLHESDDDRPMSSDAGAMSDVSSQPEQLDHPSADECWIVTPPPCFSGSARGLVMTTSPMEDLLIEHPSMSVYQPQHRIGVNYQQHFTPARLHPLPALHSPDVEMPPPPPPPPPPAQSPVRAVGPQPVAAAAANFIPPAAARSMASSWHAATCRVRRENSRHVIDRRNRTVATAAVRNTCRRNRRIAMRNSGANYDRHCQ